MCSSDLCAEIASSKWRCGEKGGELGIIRHEDCCGPRGIANPNVVIQGARIVRKIRFLSELNSVDEDCDEDLVGLIRRLADETRVAVMKCTHGRYKGDGSREWK